jgi:autophagy-related protein 2
MLGFNIPFVQVDVFKPVLDCLQFWADDISQLIERTFNGDGDSDQLKNIDRSITKTRSTGASKSVRSGGKSETVVKIAISDGIFSNHRSYSADEAFNSIC